MKLFRKYKFRNYELLIWNFAEFYYYESLLININFHKPYFFYKKEFSRNLKYEWITYFGYVELRKLKGN